jgi:apolipoprotein N-acyltransferase
LQLSFKINCLLIIVSGLLLGCSAPGLGFWPTAWFALAPLLISIRQESSFAKATFYGFLFGLAFNFVYLQWYLGLAPMDWLGFNAWQGHFLAGTALCLLYKLLLNFLDKLIQAKYSIWNNLLQIFIVPLLWILVTNKIGNAHDLTGVPWSMLEYTQYKQLAFIQVADIIGGIGICFLLVMVNTAIAQIFWVIFSFKQNSQIFISNRVNQPIQLQSAFKKNILSLIISVALIVSALIYGNYKLSMPQRQEDNVISIVQPNINIEMEKTKKRFSVEELLALQFKLSNGCPANGLCIWTESSLPIRLSNSEEIQSILKSFVYHKNASLIIGTIDEDRDANLYNAAWGISSSGHRSKNIYHKRYLVPFGEYTPAFVRSWPDWILSLTNTPAGSGYSSGQEPALLDINDKLIAPLICFEVISPELAAASIRAGGQLLVNMNDLAWFHQSIIGEQMIACAVLRAVENRRDIIFAANTGPSAVISAWGNVKSYIGQNKACNLISKFNYSSKLSIFTRWFVF